MNIKNNRKFNLYSLLTNLAIIGLFVSVGVAVLMLTRVLPFTSISINIVLILAILCLMTICALPWIKRLQEGRYKILSIIAISFSGLMFILLSVASILIINTLFNIAALTEEYLISILTYLKVMIIIAIQYLIFNLVTYCVTKYKKQYLPFQVIMYASNLFVDFYVTFLAFSLSLTVAEGFTIAPIASFLWTKGMLVTLTLAITFAVLSLAILKRIEIRRFRKGINKAIALDLINHDNDNIDKKLDKLNKLKEKNLISEEEYNKKRDEIINKL